MQGADTNTQTSTHTPMREEMSTQQIFEFHVVSVMPSIRRHRHLSMNKTYQAPFDSHKIQFPSYMHVTSHSSQFVANIFATKPQCIAVFCVSVLFELILQYSRNRWQNTNSKHTTLHWKRKRNAAIPNAAISKRKCDGEEIYSAKRCMCYDITAIHEQIHTIVSNAMKFQSNERPKATNNSCN